MNWLSAAGALIAAIMEAFKAAFIWDAAKTKAKLESMEHEKDLLDAANSARMSDSVPDDQDPYNRSK
jgi:hypothetical protein